MYLCEALNAAGRDQKLVQLSVLGTSCLSPTPSVSPRPHTLRQHSQERGQPAPGGSLGCPAPSLGSRVSNILACRVGHVAFETHLCASLLCDLGQVAFPL